MNDGAIGEDVIVPCISLVCFNVSLASDDKEAVDDDLFVSGNVAFIADTTLVGADAVVDTDAVVVGGNPVLAFGEAAKVGRSVVDGRLVVMVDVSVVCSGDVVERFDA